MMHKISHHLQSKYDCHFTPYYADGLINILARLGLLQATSLGLRHQNDTLAYIKKHHLKLDLRGASFDYDLVITGSDLVIQRNIGDKRLILVQEGITEPENLFYYLVKWFKFPRYLANTSTTGLSNKYDVFCVSSNGYRDKFIQKGVDPDKIVVTGIPNFDDFEKYRENDFPFKGFVLVATTPLRETFRYDNRKEFLKRCYRIASGRQIIFKLHPTEIVSRAEREIMKYCPGALVFTQGSVEHMIAKADVVITQQSTCTFTALALQKEVYTYLDVEELQRLMPIQNHGTSAEKIANICGMVLNTPLSFLRETGKGFRSHPEWSERSN